jgi:hypothetical protein
VGRFESASGIGDRQSLYNGVTVRGISKKVLGVVDTSQALPSAGSMVSGATPRTGMLGDQSCIDIFAIELEGNTERDRGVATEGELPFKIS